MFINIGQNTIVRTATIRDAKLLADIGSRTFLYAFVDYNIDMKHIQFYIGRMFTEVQLKKELYDQNTFFLIAEKEGKILGYTKIVRYSSDVAVTAKRPVQLQRMYVDKHYHRNGIGKAMLKKVSAMAKEYGHDKMWLNVGLENGKAISFYERFGFKKIGKVKSYQFGEITLDAEFMEKEL